MLIFLKTLFALLLYLLFLFHQVILEFYYNHITHLFLVLRLLFHIEECLSLLYMDFLRLLHLFQQVLICFLFHNYQNQLVLNHSFHYLVLIVNHLTYLNPIHLLSYLMLYLMLFLLFYLYLQLYNLPHYNLNLLILIIFDVLLL